MPQAAASEHGRILRDFAARVRAVSRCVLLLEWKSQRREGSRNGVEGMFVWGGRQRMRAERGWGGGRVRVGKGGWMRGKASERALWVGEGEFESAHAS